MKIGILAVQGAFIEHQKMLESLDCDCIQLRKKDDICTLDGIVLPGGESTVQGKLLHELNMFEPLKKMIQAETPVLATCAGLILLAEHISNDKNVYFGTMPVTVKRNAYGRQLGSFKCNSDFAGIGPVDMTFIRAPYIEKTSDKVKILAVVNNKIIAVQHKNQVGLAFHPELDKSPAIHQYFLKLIK